MVVFYAAERLAGRSETVIWSTNYYQASWQVFFDAFNSLPAVALGLILAWRLRSPPLRLLFLSLGLHCLADLALHHDDAHRHFLPLSSWRFASPVSYWDPDHFGRAFLALEFGFVLLSCAFLARRAGERAVRHIALGTLGCYLAFGAFAWWSWVGPGS